MYHLIILVLLWKSNISIKKLFEAAWTSSDLSCYLDKISGTNMGNVVGGGGEENLLS